MDEVNKEIIETEEIEEDTETASVFKLGEGEGIVYVEPILLESEIVEKMEGFKEGMEEYSKLAGAFTVLVNAGMSSAQAHEIISSRDAQEMNVKIAMAQTGGKEYLEQMKNF